MLALQRAVAYVSRVATRYSSSGTLSSLSNLMNNDDSLSTVVAHDKYGYTINGIHMRGSVIVFRNFTLLWNVQKVIQITPRNLAPVHMIRPKPDILFIGTGDSQQNINPSLYAYFSRKGISIEPMQTTHAIATFNNLNQEGRRVAAALVSREPVTWEEACLYTPEMTESEHDRRLKQVLSRDYTTKEVSRLLEAGSSSKQNADAPSVPKTVVSAPSTTTNFEDESAALAVRYGYPGALPPDISVVDKDAAARAAERSRKPQTAEEFLDARARRATRRSSNDRDK